MSRALIVLLSFAVFCFQFPGNIANTPCKGCISIDEYGFHKFFNKFETVLVKFDVAYPYGDKHDVFKSVCEEMIDNNNIICSEVGVKDYGEKDNEDFAKKYGVLSKDDLPSIRLFVRGEDEPFAFGNKMPWTNDNMKKFIRDHTNIYLGLPGCLEVFDKLAMKFSTSNNKEAILKESQKTSDKLTSENEKRIAHTYLKFMRKILDNGTPFVKQEIARLSKIVSGGKVKENKKEELNNRLNILKSFESVPIKTEL